jgi:hypothetical protein
MTPTIAHCVRLLVVPRRRLRLFGLSESAQADSEPQTSAPRGGRVSPWDGPAAKQVRWAA